MQKPSDADLLAAFKIKSINRASVVKWFNKELALSLLNYQQAAKDCGSSDWTCPGNISSTADLLAKAQIWRATIPPQMLAWRDNLADFSLAYIAEQMRLAALFPKVSSEIDLFNDKEWNGDEFADRQFFLSFDDGPSAVHGTSDDVLAMLEENHKNAVFFVLGENFQARLHKTDANTLSGIYKHQCVASHGWEHQSHAKWAQWQDSIKRTQALITSVIAKENFLPLFRPPYGQRKADSGAFFQAQSLRVALWNLDSQDWNAHIDVDDIINRMMVLMLIKRHGVLLFHDVHAKAKAALPVLFNELGNAVTWGDCHLLATHDAKGN
ncbi:polysaccharide deacetylase family protein [Methylovulum sp.]|uniref:polysaccharide deacetylase family protein n=1 Tax=Methylovulum sp. TaxID=1916980 RepID=UPI0026396965|nr:polysaccharide deacetylase family protein [Methylovulum sp.]MDD5123444.1 polysaccharide deacetylase family protein [Methylovulum sp.]